MSNKLILLFKNIYSSKARTHTENMLRPGLSLSTNNAKYGLEFLWRNPLEKTSQGLLVLARQIVSF